MAQTCSWWQFASILALVKLLVPCSCQAQKSDWTASHAVQAAREFGSAVVNNCEYEFLAEGVRESPGEDPTRTSALFGLFRAGGNLIVDYDAKIAVPARNGRPAYDSVFRRQQIIRPTHSALTIDYVSREGFGKMGSVVMTNSTLSTEEQLTMAGSQIHMIAGIGFVGPTNLTLDQVVEMPARETRISADGREVVVATETAYGVVSIRYLKVQSRFVISMVRLEQGPDDLAIRLAPSVKIKDLKSPSTNPWISEIHLQYDTQSGAGLVLKEYSARTAAGHPKGEQIETWTMKRKRFARQTSAREIEKYAARVRVGAPVFDTSDGPLSTRRYMWTGERIERTIDATGLSVAKNLIYRRGTYFLTVPLIVITALAMISILLGVRQWRRRKNRSTLNRGMD